MTSQDEIIPVGVGGGGGGFRLSSILEEDAFANGGSITPQQIRVLSSPSSISSSSSRVMRRTPVRSSIEVEEEGDGTSSNPLKEALDAITVLAEEGDFDDNNDDDDFSSWRNKANNNSSSRNSNSKPWMRQPRRSKSPEDVKKVVVEEEEEINSRNNNKPWMRQLRRSKSPEDVVVKKVVVEEEASLDDDKENNHVGNNGHLLQQQQHKPQIRKMSDRIERRSATISEEEEEEDEEEEKDKEEEKVEEKKKEEQQPVRIVVTNPLEEVPISSTLHRSGGQNGGYNFEKILEPSAHATNQGALLRCPTCERTFLQPAYERHVRICQKVGTRKLGAEVTAVAASPTLARKFSNGEMPSPSQQPIKKKPLKPEDEFKKCPHCDRKFGPKPYDRHVEWCAEKSLRLQDSPNKDLVALAKLHARTAYRPKTPAKKDDDSPSRKISFNAGDSPLPYGSSFSRSDSRNSRRSSERRTSNGGGAAGDISSLGSKDHTIETQETQFIRAATGRGSIKRGPAPTKASQLRQLAKDQALQKLNASASLDPSPTYAPSSSSSLYSSFRSKTPNYAPRLPAMSPMSHRRNNNNTAAAPMSSSYHAGTSNSNSLHNPMYSFQPVVKPAVVRPSGYRRDPEGIEHDQQPTQHNNHGKESQLGSYDHSAEYDPYQSAARQMQELLFGSSSSNGNNGGSSNGSSSSNSANLRPSVNSAFEKYVPSTVDINTKLNSKSSFLHDPVSSSSSSNPYLTVPRRADNLKGTGGTGNANATTTLGNGWSAPGSSSAFTPFASSSNGGKTVVNFNPVVSARNPAAAAAVNASAAPSSSATTSAGRSKSPKVARFCHECGNPFALPGIRFCCECGVKRLYC